MRKSPPTVVVGCCGFAMAQENYFSRFPCVEIDSSFYNLPKIETARRWRESAPENFQFALKAWQVITHSADSPTFKRTRIDTRDRPYCGGFGFNATIRWAWDETFAVAKAMQAFLVLFQCPASFRPNKDNVNNLRKFFEHAKRGKLLFGWEPRGTWDTDLVAKLCDELDLVHVVNPLQAPPARQEPVRYFRLHATGRFSEEELRRLRHICVAERSPAYCLFNNPAAASDAERLARLLGAS